MAGLGGLNKLHKMQDSMKGKPDPAHKEKGKVAGDDGPPANGGEPVTMITHHGDGSHTVKTHDGAEEHHPTHLHAGAHLLHHMSGGDKHHIVHHDGMSATSHSIGEDGSHDGPHEHNSAEEAKGALDKFLGEEAQEPEHGGDGQEEPMHSHAAYGGM